MKKLTVFIAGFLYLLLSPVLVFAQSATLSMVPASGTFNPGCTFSLAISVNTGGAQTDGTDAILFYDPTRFTATSIQSGTIYSDYPGNNIDTQAGRITISGLSSVTTAFSGSGTLATMNFTVVNNAPVGASQVKFDFDPSDKAKTTDSNVVERGTIADILGQVVDGNYTVGTGSCGSSVTPPQGGVESTPSATPTLAVTGSPQMTVVVAIAGVALTVLGILGLALL